LDIENPKKNQDKNKDLDQIIHQFLVLHIVFWTDCECQDMDIPSVLKIQAQTTVTVIEVIIEENIFFNWWYQENIKKKGNDNLFNLIGNNYVVQ